MRMLAVGRSISIWMFLGLMGVSHAENYPARPVRVVVPFPAGTATDLSARVAANYLQKSLGQPFVVDNKPGAGGSIGAIDVVRAAPDGYTIMIASNSALSANVALLKSMPYDPARDLTPIAGVSQTTLVLMVKKDLPVNNVKELVAYVKERPGKITAGYGSSSSQIAIAKFNQAAHLDVLSVPYKGIPLAVTDLIGGTVDFTFVDLGNALAHAKGGSLKPLAVVSVKRNALVPDWPAMSEQFPGFDIPTWVAVAGPVGLPANVIETLQKTIDTALKEEDVKNRLAGVGFAPMPMKPAALKKFLVDEIAKWKVLASEANVQPQ